MILVSGDRTRRVGLSAPQCRQAHPATRSRSARRKSCLVQPCECATATAKARQSASSDASSRPTAQGKSQPANPLRQISRLSLNRNRTGIAMRTGAMAQIPIRRHRHDQAAAIGKAVEPACRRRRADGVAKRRRGIDGTCVPSPSITATFDRAPGWLWHARQGSHHIRFP